MKMRDFEKLVAGTVVKIGHRRARMEGTVQIAGGYGSTKEYAWANFRYIDTGRRVTKRHRQVEMVEPEKSMIETLEEKHQARIARDTLRMPDAIAGVMGGPTKQEAREFLGSEYDESTNPSNGWLAPDREEDQNR